MFIESSLRIPPAIREQESHGGRHQYAVSGSGDLTLYDTPDTFATSSVTGICNMGAVRNESNDICASPSVTDMPISEGSKMGGACTDLHYFRVEWH